MLACVVVGLTNDKSVSEGSRKLKIFALQSVCGDSYTFPLEQHCLLPDSK